MTSTSLREQPGQTVTQLSADPLGEEMIGHYARHLEEEDHAESTITSYLEALHRANRELPAGLPAANTDELRAWIHTPGRAKATKALYSTIVRGFTAWAVNPGDEDPWLDYDAGRGLPAVRVPRNKPKPIADEEIAVILGRSDRPHLDRYELALFAGARCVEISRLDREHIGSRWVELWGKGDRVRPVPCHPRLKELARSLPPGPVAVGADGVRLTRQQVAHNAHYNLHRVLGLGEVSMHRLRHTFGTRAYAQCKDIRVVQELMGHESIGTTQGYVEASAELMMSTVVNLPI